VAVVAAGALALPSAALAATLTVDHNAHTAAYSADPGEVNNLSFYRLYNTYRIQDSGVAGFPLNELGGALCTQSEAWKYRCPTTSITAANVSLGDGADTFDGSNSSIAFTITAGPSAKKITTGAGVDTIDARNGSVDQISCGDGADKVASDANDVVDASCEQVNATDNADGTTDTNPSSTAGGSQGSGGNAHPTVFQTPLGLTVALASVPVANYNARLKLACAAEADQGCRGEVVLEVPPAAGNGAKSNRAVAARGQYVARQRRRNRQLGKRSYRIEAGGKTTVAIPVRARGHYRYVTRRRRSRAILRITERDPSGKLIDVQTRSVTLTAKQGQR
jgi:hypothetical protein